MINDILYDTTKKPIFGKLNLKKVKNRTNGCETKPPILEWDKTADFGVGQNSRFWKRGKIADFDNETKPPILKWDKLADLL